MAARRSRFTRTGALQKTGATDIRDMDSVQMTANVLSGPQAWFARDTWLGLGPSKLQRALHALRWVSGLYLR
jgi:hypothetical protein